MHKRFLIALTAMAAGAAAAQGGRTDPAEPKVKVAPLEYRSAFEGYRPYAEEKPAPWRDANEAVKGNGGHAGHSPKPPAKPKPAAGDKR